MEMRNTGGVGGVTFFSNVTQNDTAPVGPKTDKTPPLVTTAPPVTGGSGTSATTSGSSIPPPDNIPLEPVSSHQLKDAMNSAVIAELMMEIAKSAQVTHHAALERSFQVQEDMVSLNEHSRELGMQAASSNYQAETTRAYGDIAGGAAEVGLSGVGLKKVRAGGKESDQIATGKAQIKANDKALGEAENKFKFETSRLDKRLKNAEAIKKAENKIEADQTHVDKLNEAEATALEKREAAKKAGKTEEAAKHEDEAADAAKQREAKKVEIADTTEQLHKARAEQDSMLPQDVRDAKAQVANAEKTLQTKKAEQASEQKDADHWKAKAEADPANSFHGELRDYHQKNVTRLNSEVADLEGKVATQKQNLKSLADPHTSVDGIKAEIQQKHADMAQFRQKTADNNRAVSDDISHLDPHSKTVSVQIWTQLAQGFSAPTRGAANLAAAGSERSGSQEQTEAKYVDGQKEVANMRYSQQSDFEKSQADVRDGAIRAVTETMSNLNDLNKDIARNTA